MPVLQLSDVSYLALSVHLPSIGLPTSAFKYLSKDRSIDCDLFVVHQLPTHSALLDHLYRYVKNR